ncbi:MAG: hypothetical protein AAF492_13320, partial [Verrucomicrobiota bacterium]
ALINVQGRSNQSVDRFFSLLFRTGWSVLVILWALRSIHDVRYRTDPKPMELIIAVTVMLNVAVYILFEGGARHHLPFVPLLILYIFSGSIGKNRPIADVRSGGD